MSFLRTSLVTFVLASISLFGCGVTETNETGETSSTLRRFPSTGETYLPTYYLAHVDPRRCAAPVCAGISISAANQKLTKCARGTFAQECLLSAVDFSSFEDPTEIDTRVRSVMTVDLETTRVVLLGTIVPMGFGRTNLRVQKAWVALDEQRISGDFFDTRVNGIVCIAAPCPSYDQEVLNRGDARSFHGFDFSAVPMHATDGTYTTPALYSDDGLIVSGENVIEESAGPAGQGTFLKVSQVFVPLALSEQRPSFPRQPPVPLSDQ